MSPRFKREELKNRYDVSVINEDDWHSYSGMKTSEFVAHHLALCESSSNWLLNAGSGVYQIQTSVWKEVSVDLFTLPIRNRPYAVCANIEGLPFPDGTFGAIVCVGEVLAYCDPAATIVEFARVLVPSGVLICDFGNSQSFRYWFKRAYGQAADLVTDNYNGAPERTWIYDPAYIRSLLTTSGFNIKAQLGTHTWSALARRMGISIPIALSVQRHLKGLQLLKKWADLTTIVAVRIASEIK